MMLENIAGKDGMPSPDLVRDLRILCRMNAEHLQAFADVFNNLPEDLTDESIPTVFFKSLNLLKVDPEKLSSSVQVALFLWDKWSAKNLTKEQIITDLQGLDIDQSILKNMMPLLEAMQKRVHDLQNLRNEANVLSTGTPTIDSANCVVDGRTVFKSSKYRDELSDSQEYYQIDHFVPIVIFEIITELNNEKTTHSYLLSESKLKQLKDILDRASKRLDVIKERLCFLTQKELSNDEKRN